jgi:DNA-binding transcriptional MerR regulator
MDSLKTEQQTAKTLNVKVGTLRAWRHRGGGPPFIKLGHVVRYSPQDLQKFVAANRRQSTKDE